MPTDIFEVHVQKSLAKLEMLWQRSSEILAFVPASTSEEPEQAPQQKLIKESLEELSASIAELQLASETLRQQNEDLLNARQQLAIERNYYKELFDNAPDAYLVTTANGTIKEANQKAVDLLGVSTKYLVRKSLAVFIELTERQQYYRKLNKIRTKAGEISYELTLSNRRGQLITTECFVVPQRNLVGEVTALRWRITPIVSKESQTDREPNQELINTLVSNLSYGLSDTTTEIAQIELDAAFQQQPATKGWRKISSQIAHLHQIVNYADCVRCFLTSKELNLAVVDYCMSAKKLCQEFNHRSANLIECIASEDCVGICSLLLLKTIVTGILEVLCYYSHNPIQLTVDRTKHSRLLLSFKTQVSATIDPDDFAFLLCLDKASLPLSNLSQLRQSAIAIAIELGQGKGEIVKKLNELELKIYLPMNACYF